MSPTLKFRTDSVLFSVSELNARIKSILETNCGLVWVRGQISNFKVPSSGHFYFTLKDERSQVKAVLFRSQHRALRFTPEDGMQVLCNGFISVYEPRGDYQLIVEIMEPEGIGALQVAFEQLKRKLQDEGLFDSSRKKPLPRRPQRIAVVTSPTGAAIRDILKVLKRSPCPLDVTVIPVRVQGIGAAAEIAEAIRKTNRLADRFGWDLIIAGRGGGSVEDLWSFNEEEVARAIATSDIPVISAVGHEIDLTISDMAADARMPTPTAAAEWIVTRLEEVNRELCAYGDRISKAIRLTLDSRTRTVTHLQQRLLDPRRRLADLRMRLDELADRLGRAAVRKLERLRHEHGLLSERLKFSLLLKEIVKNHELIQQITHKLVYCHQQRLMEQRLNLRGLFAQLEALNPLSVLGRGYAIVYRLPGKSLIRNWTQAEPGDKVLIRLSGGRLKCVVEDGEKD